ncbi:MAG: tRNA uridine-5-carboxymethylaminomethyl(34) synthesis enzyme MnmG [Defluviitaleaceae bacterium]|nr:tRNA uridine-5-carboxymethylaminomethyl(34) synthesis enzyme MnmG [Defluviitaleaceae bacterium]
MDKSHNNYRIVVIGGGHAGCEAALASAHMGMKTLLLALDLNSIAMMHCNPCIGGSAKGHLVREIDALGGQMGKVIDKTFLQSRMLNLSKGPAVYSLRAQADKSKYSQVMKQVLENTPNLTIRQGEVIDILTQNGKVTGVHTEFGTSYFCDAVIVCAGTYLNSRCLCGDTIIQSGPGGMRASQRLTSVIADLGFKVMRFKTGTPARVHRDSIDFSRTAPQPGDVPVVQFSFETPAISVQIPQITCHLTYTNEETHKIIAANLHRSPMYAGIIEGVGTRYCPSIEDKISRFADKDRHPVFIEPEGADTAEMYIQGLSTSLPEDVQVAMYRTVPGLENCHIMRNGYAIEYDCIDTTNLTLTLEAKAINGLYFAGQVNGTSGYEEAAAQGLMAGINAALKLQSKPPLIIDRGTGYIGVLIDDLVTKGTPEPYRMMTSRAEYRLLLRQDNADLRLTELGYQAGLISEERYQYFVSKRDWIEKEVSRAKEINIAPSAALNALLTENNSTPLTTGTKLSDLVKRPELNYQQLIELQKDILDPALKFGAPPSGFFLNFKFWQEQVNIQIKYEGYIQMQMSQVANFRKLEQQDIPKNIKYEDISGMRIEARQKLAALLPENIGQASRVSGVSPADINVLLVYLKQLKGDLHTI